ncbi:protein RKD1-like [Ipomoea triloba]|uniref:protein RKD1-like n=1 Tax=Ipomoea triloba TaxID=35885 RepID=UPI00125DE802|nr:protein RKD1-like [Ipomoea triloba]
MEHQAFSSSFFDQVECPCSEYSEHYIWDYQYDALPLMPADEAIAFAKQVSEIGQDVATTEDVNVEEISTVVVGNDTRPSKRLWNFEMVSKYFHLPMNQAVKGLNIKEACLQKICKKVGIDQWPYKKLRTLERLAKNVQGNTDHREITNELENQREQMLKDPNLQSGIERNKLKVSHKKRKYQNLTKLSYYAPLASSSYVSANPLPKTKNEDTMYPSCT